ncbi:MULTISPECIES: hypothetical protein [Protofrankia]|uniref:Uncharacterized protein n=1 Tax=Candidatus Protofrankia datiscae TaxID=2716812 RepID=F8B3W8_9ACTN|nr:MULTISPECIES: hypothetical protein [Protofrankia]AEH09068.1 hypothetical protein FsymDg_1612 [Candidatus Protofrankia datiscae]
MTLRAPQPDQEDSSGPNGDNPDEAGPDEAGPNGSDRDGGGEDGQDGEEEETDRGAQDTDGAAQDDQSRGDLSQGDSGRSAAEHRIGPERGSTPTSEPASSSVTSDPVGRPHRFLSTGRTLAGSSLLGVLIALADLASAWVIVVLPLTAAVMAAYNEAIKKMLAADDTRSRLAENEPSASRTPPD